MSTSTGFPTPRSGQGVSWSESATSGGPILVAALGDSITGNGTYVAATVGSYAAQGFTTWAMAFSMGRLWCPIVWEIGASSALINYNRGVSGETAEQCLARVPEIDALPRKPRFCSVLIGTNNLTAGTQTAVQIHAVLMQICSELIRRGITPVLCTLLPRGNGTSSGWGSLTAGQITTARGRLLEINRLIRAYAAATPAVILADIWSSVVNFASATSDPDVAYLSDYLHPGAAGAIRIGQAWWNAVAPYLSTAPVNACGGGDAWSSADNPYGSQINGTFAASGGTAGTGVTGTVPSGWTANRLSGSTSTAVVTQQARADGALGYEATIAMTGSDNATFRMYEGASTLTNANFSAGDAFYVESEVVFNGTGANQYQNPDIEVRCTSGSITARPANNNAVGDIRGNYTFLQRTPLVVVPVGGLTGTSSVWTVDGIRNGGTATVTRRNITLRKHNKSAPGALTW